MEYTMLPKHLHGFKEAFPEVDDADFETLFAAGYHTPGDIKKATDTELKKVLSTSKVTKLRNGRKSKP